MSYITRVVTPSSQISPFLMHRMFRLRHQVFYERLAWDVPSISGLERDHYDEAATRYVLAETPQGRLVGCTRLLPTTGPYMLRDSFPQLLAGEPAPVDPCIWDASRFAVCSPSAKQGTPLSQHSPALVLIEKTFEYGLNLGIQSYVAVVSLGLERIFQRLGLKTQRFGHGKATRVGRVQSVALWIRVDTSTHEALKAKHQHQEVA